MLLSLACWGSGCFAGWSSPDLLSAEVWVEADDCLSEFGDEVRPCCCAPGGMFGGGGGSFCRREVVLRGRVETMRLVRMKEVRRDIMMIGCMIYSRRLWKDWNETTQWRESRVKSKRDQSKRLSHDIIMMEISHG